MLNLVADMDRILAVARAHRVAVVEDACQAIGVTYRGRRVGAIGDAGAFSFQQNKNLKSGEGGAVLTQDSTIYSRARMFHDLGSYIRRDRSDEAEPAFVGLNLRMPELSSAILRPQLARLDRQIQRRRRLRELLVEHLSRQGDIRISPHHAPDEAVGLAVVFDDAGDAAAFGEQRGVARLVDTGRHVYTNWQPIVNRRTYDAREPLGGPRRRLLAGRLPPHSGNPRADVRRLAQPRAASSAASRTRAYTTTPPRPPAAPRPMGSVGR